jgi:hypothetical protein
MVGDCAMVRLIRLLLQVVQHIIVASWFVFPVVGRLVMFTIGLSVLGFLAIWQGIPNVVRGVAREWTERAIRAGFPRIWEVQLYGFFCIVAFLSVVVGWLATSFMTVVTVILLT